MPGTRASGCGRGACIEILPLALCPKSRGRCRAHGLEVDTRQATFFLGRETLLGARRGGMARWRQRIFSFMSRNALRATAYFRIPAERVFEVGVQVEL